MHIEEKLGAGGDTGAVDPVSAEVSEGRPVTRTAQ
jgi:hypothetical protein